MYRDPAEPHHETAVAIANGRLFKLEYKDGRLERAESVALNDLESLTYEQGRMCARGKHEWLVVDMSGEQFTKIFGLVRWSREVLA